MKKEKIKEILPKAIIIVIALFFIINIIKIMMIGKQQIEVTTAQNYDLSTSFEATVALKSIKTSDDLAGTIKVKLVNADGKKVKNTNKTYKIEQGQTANISLELPENLETGKYYLKITASSKKGRDTIKKEINIIGKTSENISIALDKGIYKPGDNVVYRALITNKESDEPTEEEIEISIYDGNSNKVYSKKANTSEYGIISDTFKLADEVNSGTYKIKIASPNQEVTKTFTVNPYTTPQFEVKIETDKESYLVGDKATIKVDSKYFFGEAVKNATVNLEINDNKIQGITNEDGIYTYEYEFKKAEKLNIKADVTDTSNYLNEANKTVFCGTDKFEIEVLPEYGQIIDGLDNDIYVFTKKADGTPVKTYINVNIGKTTTRQVITDENGIGKISLTSGDISQNASYTSNKSNNNNEDDYYTMVAPRLYN